MADSLLLPGGQAGPVGVPLPGTLVGQGVRAARAGRERVTLTTSAHAVVFARGLVLMGSAPSDRSATGTYRALAAVLAPGPSRGLFTATASSSKNCAALGQHCRPPGHGAAQQPQGQLRLECRPPEPALLPSLPLQRCPPRLAAAFWMCPAPCRSAKHRAWSLNAYCSPRPPASS